MQPWWGGGADPAHRGGVFSRDSGVQWGSVATFGRGAWAKQQRCGGVIIIVIIIKLHSLLPPLGGPLDHLPGGAPHGPGRGYTEGGAPGWVQACPHCSPRPCLYHPHQLFQHYDGGWRRRGGVFLPQTFVELQPHCGFFHGATGHGHLGTLPFLPKLLYCCCCCFYTCCCPCPLLSRAPCGGGSGGELHGEVCGGVAG